MRQTARRIRERARKRAKRLRNRVLVTWLRAHNRYARRSVVGDAPVVVSLTSYGRRVADVAWAIESISRGRVRPRRLVLWLDEPLDAAAVPPSLRRLEARGLEIVPTVDLGPHKKYYPYAASIERHELPLVTADDDVMYARRWLDDLLEAHRALPDTVVCHRGNRVLVEDDGLAPYDSWPRCRSDRPSFAHFATGVSGVLYPPRMLDALRERGTAFLDAAPTADDIWLHWVALRLGIAVRQVRATPVHFPLIPGSQVTSLTATNVAGGINDRWIARLYSPDDVRVIARS